MISFANFSLILLPKKLYTASLWVVASTNTFLLYVSTSYNILILVMSVVNTCGSVLLGVHKPLNTHPFPFYPHVVSADVLQAVFAHLFLIFIKVMFVHDPLLFD